MNCKEVLTLIATVPLRELTRSQLGSLESHADDCGGCRVALDEARRLEAWLDSLPEALPPADLGAAVMRRLAALEAPAPGRRERSSRTPRASGYWPWLAAALAGIVMGSVVQGYRVVTGEAAPDFVGMAFSAGERLALLQGPSPAGFALLILGLLGLAGLFLSVRDSWIAG